MDTTSPVLIKMAAAICLSSRFPPGAAVDTLALYARISAQIRQAQAEGYSTLRVCIDMDWAAEDALDARALVAYEMGQNTLPLVDQSILLCMYDRRKFASSVLLPVLQVHSAVTVGTRVVPNRFYLPPQPAAVQDLPSALLDASLNVLADSSERMQYQQKLKRTLEEKEVVLREIHHRVKNNLSVIIALIGLQEGNNTNPTIAQTFKDLQARVYSMALVHESLYRAPDLARVNFASYLKTLTAHLHQIYAQPDQETRPRAPIRLVVQAEDVALRVDTAIPCGLIVNELVTNAMKYAFPPDQAGQESDPHVTVSLARVEGAVRLRIADNGVGLSSAEDWHTASTLGLQLAQMLARQLKARLELVEQSAGVCWLLEFHD